MKLQFLLAALLFASGADAQQTVGVFSRTSASQDGYVLFAPITSNTTYLIDKCGKSVHSWSSTRKPGQSVYLLPDGTLLRPGNAGNTTFNAGGTGGIIQRLDWNSNVLWSYTISSAAECQHHDVCYLPNGNILAIVWESKTGTEAIAAGRNPSQLGTTLWSEKIVELQPSGSSGATIVWEWHVWDHLVQEQDNSKTNYGAVAQHPELINLNYNGTANTTSSDWLHLNSVAYNARLDQVMLSVHNFSEVWILDHSTTTAQATAHNGGLYGRGGDLLYRWGNPAAYNRGTSSNRVFYAQHNAQWIEGGLPDSGKIMVFNNGQARPGGNYSSIDVFSPPVDASGSYTLSGSAAYGPVVLYWQYKASTPADFYAQNISGAQRLSSGNTLICEGPGGHFFEVDASGNTAWKYVNPVTLSGPVSQGTTVSQNSVFRCTQYSASYSGLAGKSLTPGVPLEQNPLNYSCAMSGSTGIDETHADALAISVTNPFGEQVELHADVTLDGLEISLYDMAGRRISFWNRAAVSAGVKTFLPVMNLPPGIYLLKIQGREFSKVMKVQH